MTTKTEATPKEKETGSKIPISSAVTNEFLKTLTTNTTFFLSQNHKINDENTLNYYKNIALKESNEEKTDLLFTVKHNNTLYYNMKLERLIGNCQNCDFKIRITKHEIEKTAIKKRSLKKIDEIINHVIKNNHRINFSQLFKHQDKRK